MYICCALVGAIKDSVSQNARCNSGKKVIDNIFFLNSRNELITIVIQFISAKF
jgi:pantothenate kinase